MHWAADRLCGIPLKTKENPRGILTEQETYDIFSVLFMCVFENVLPENGWTLRAAAKQVGDILNKMIKNSIGQAAPLHAGLIGGLVGGLASWLFLRRKPRDPRARHPSYADSDPFASPMLGAHDRGSWSSVCTTHGPGPISCDAASESSAASTCPRSGEEA